MTIQRTDAHRKMLIEQAADGVLSLQYDVAVNAAVHKQWAIERSAEFEALQQANQSVIITDTALSELQTMIADTITAYNWRRSKLRHFRDVIIPADAGFMTVGDQLMLTLQSVGVVGTAVADHIDAFAAMPRTTYAEIIAACDYLLANVQPPETIWD